MIKIFSYDKKNTYDMGWAASNEFFSGIIVFLQIAASIFRSVF